MDVVIIPFICAELDFFFYVNTYFALYNICGGAITCNISFAHLTFFFHASSKAFVESAETTLVPLIFVNHTLSAEPVQDKQQCGLTLQRKIEFTLTAHVVMRGAIPVCLD